MSESHAKTVTVTSDQASLRRRIRSLYRRYDAGDWERCYTHLDPNLRAEGKISRDQYADSLSAFRQRYGNINIWYLRVSLHLDADTNKHDPRPFAYAYVFWQDDNKAFHVFRERWVKEGARWYTRVVGLVA